MKFALLVPLVFILSGCSSWLMRQQCDKINWFAHGEAVAMRGERLDSDKMVLECRKAEADMSESQLDKGFKSGMQKYCSPEIALKTGKSGDFFSRDLCDGPQINVLLNQHKNGVQEFCAKSNGQQAGASGKKYNGICPKNLEGAFMPEYRKGRKRYVNAMIENKQQDVRELESKISYQRLNLSHNQGRLAGMQSELNSLQSQRNFTSATNTAQLSYLDSRIQSLSTDVSTLRNSTTNAENSIRSLEADRNGSLNDIAEYKKELPSLDSE